MAEILSAMKPTDDSKTKVASRQKLTLSWPILRKRKMIIS